MTMGSAPAFNIPTGVNNGWISVAVNYPPENILLQVADNFSNVDGVTTVNVEMTVAKAKSLIRSLNELIKECEL